MTTKIFDRCMFTPTQGGLIDWTVSAAVQGYMMPVQAGVSNGDTVYYVAENSDRSQWELGSGVYTTSSTTIARTTILFSSNSNAKVDFTSTPSVFLVLPAEYLTPASDATLVMSDITTNDVSTSKHGFAPKAPNDATKYLDGTGAYSTPSAPASAPGFHPGFVTGRYYTKPFGSSGTTTFSLVASTLYAHPFYVPTATTITKIAANVNSGASGKVLELGIYTDVGGQPSALELDAGNVSVTGTGAAIITVNHTLQPGWYWLVMASNGTPTMNCSSANDQPTAYLFGVSSASLTTPIGLITAPWTFSAGALPGTFPAITYSNAACPLIWVAP